MARRIPIITSSLDGEKPDTVNGEPLTTLTVISVLIQTDYRFNTDSVGVLTGGRIIRKAKKKELEMARQKEGGDVIENFLDLESEDWKFLKDVAAKPQGIGPNGPFPIGYTINPSYLCVEHIDAINEAKEIK